MKKVDAATELKPIIDNPEFAAAQEKRRQIGEQRRAREVELRQVEIELHALLSRNADADVEDRARAIVAGQDVAPAASFQPLSERMARLRMEISAYRRAEVLQKSAIADLVNDLSVPASETLRPRHQAACRAILAAVDQLREAIEAEQAVRMELQDAGYDHTRLPAMQPPLVLPDPSRDSIAAAWFNRIRAWVR